MSTPNVMLWFLVGALCGEGLVLIASYKPAPVPCAAGWTCPAHTRAWLVVTHLVGADTRQPDTGDVYCLCEPGEPPSGERLSP